MTDTDAPGAAGSHRWDLDYDSNRARPLLRHGYWDVLWGLAKRDFHARYRQSGLRTLWSLWQPLSIVVINGFFFYAVLGVDGGGLPYLAFIVASIMAFRYLATGLGASTVISDNSSLVVKAYFPRELIPLSTLVVSLVDLAAMGAILIVVSIAQGVGPTWTAIALPLYLALLLLFTIAITLFLSTVTVFVRDVSFLMPMVNQLLFLGSPIMYPVERTPRGFGWLNSVNPVAVVVEGIRDVMLRHQWPNFGLLGIHLVVNGGMAIAALRYLRAVEPRMADIA